MPNGDCATHAATQPSTQCFSSITSALNAIGRTDLTQALKPNNLVCNTSSQCAFHPIIQAINTLPNSLEFVLSPDLGDSTRDDLTPLFTQLASNIIPSSIDIGGDAPVNVGFQCLPIPSGANRGSITTTFSGNPDLASGLSCGAIANQQQPSPPPSITSLLFPPWGPPRGGTAVEFGGNNFEPGQSRVLFGLTEANASCTDATRCTAISPPGNGSANVVVYNPASRESSAAGANTIFNYLPTITGVSPRSGLVGDDVTILGTGLTSPFSFGPFKVAELSCDPRTPGQCTVKVPPGSGDVDVTSGSGDATSAVTPADRFSYLPPSIQDMDVRTGPVSGGTEVTITGAGFDANDTGAMKILFGSVNSDYVLCEKSKTRCFVRSPKAPTPGPVHVIVKIFDAVSTPGASDLFNYTEFPLLKAINFNSLQNENASVVLDGFAPDEGASVSLTTSDPSLLIVPSVVTVNSGADGAIFPKTYVPTPRSGSVTIAASYKGSAANVNVPIVAWPPIALDINSASLAATVTLNAPAPAGGGLSRGMLKREERRCSP